MIISAQYSELLAYIRNARGLMLRDAESFHEASTVLEHIGQVLAAQIRRGLGEYRDEILSLAGQVQHIDAEEIRRLFNVVKEARNMVVHDGAWARHFTSRLIDLFLVLEEAIISEMTLVGDLMVRNPVFAEPWHLIAHVRKMMLANSFSTIPLAVENDDIRRWDLLTDGAIMKVIRGAKTKEERSRRLSLPITNAIEEGLLAPETPYCCLPTELISNVISKTAHLPVLVIDEAKGKSHLIGILTSFDLL